MSSQHCDTWQYLVTFFFLIWSQFSLILFNLVPIFVIFVQFSPNFVSIQNDQIKKINENFIENFIFIKIHIYFKYFFHYFYTKPNYNFGGKLLYMGDFWYMLKNRVKVTLKLEEKFFIVFKIRKKILHYFLNDSVQHLYRN